MSVMITGMSLVTVLGDVTSDGVGGVGGVVVTSYNGSKCGR